MSEPASGPFPAEWFVGPVTVADVRTVQGWRHFVTHREDYRPPVLLKRSTYDSLPDGHRGLYDLARRIGLSNMPRHITPMGQSIREQMRATLTANSMSFEAGVRPGLFLSADAGLGKSTLMRQIAAEFDQEVRGLADFLPSRRGRRDRWVPVAWVNVPPKVSIIGLCRQILSYYGEVTSRSDREADLTQRVFDTMTDCDTRLIVLDDITRLKMHREADQNAADFIRSMMETSATIIGIGVGVEQSGLLSEGQASPRNRRLMTQTRRRFTVHSLRSFTDETTEAFTGWLAHLQRVEDNLLLLDKAPGMLTAGDTPAYLLRRTGGVIGTLTRLITESSLRVLGRAPGPSNPGEYLTRDDLDAVTLDHGAEDHELAHDEVRQPSSHPRRTGSRRARNGAFDGKQHRGATA